MRYLSFSVDEVSIEIADADRQVALITIVTPVGEGRLLGQLRFDGDILYVEAAHVEGLAPGVLGQRGINVVLRRILLEADVKQIDIQGARRTTSTHRGQVPSAIIFPRRAADRLGG